MKEEEQKTTTASCDAEYRRWCSAFGLPENAATLKLYKIGRRDISLCEPLLRAKVEQAFG